MENSGDTLSTVSITAKGLAKDFNRRPIFRDVSFSLSTSSSLAITGKNGSGKSTLSKMIAGLMNATRGSLVYQIEHAKVDIEVFKHHIGFVSPYLNLYDEFTALENLHLLSRIRGSHVINEESTKDALEVVGLWKRRNDLVGTYSSGMKQRLKYSFAVLHHPAVLILDEPTSNLDADGIEYVQQVVMKQKKDGILIMATNDAHEAGWCEHVIQVG
jgi:heme exporter protein A